MTFELSAEDRFQEQAERWVDVPSRRLLPAPVVGRLTRAAVAEATGSDETAADGDLLAAIAEAHRLIDAAALARRTELAAGASAKPACLRARRHRQPSQHRGRGACRPLPPAAAPASKPTGSGRPVVPPHVRRENARRVRSAPGKFAEDFWNAVVAGDQGEMAAILAPGWSCSTGGGHGTGCR